MNIFTLTCAILIWKTEQALGDVSNWLLYITPCSKLQKIFQKNISFHKLRTKSFLLKNAKKPIKWHITLQCEFIQQWPFILINGCQVVKVTILLQDTKDSGTWTKFTKLSLFLVSSFKWEFIIFLLPQNFWWINQ